MRAFKLNDSIYYFNTEEKTQSLYTLHNSGFLFTFTKYSETDFLKQFNFVNLNVNTIEITIEQVQQFCDMLYSLQKNSNELKPLVPFEQHIESIAGIYNINLKNNY